MEPAKRPARFSGLRHVLGLVGLPQTARRHPASMKWAGGHFPKGTSDSAESQLGRILMCDLDLIYHGRWRI